MKIYFFLIPLGVGLIVQMIKMILDFFSERQIKLSNFWRAGGFPSVHSALSTSVTTLVGLYEGVDSLLFAVALIFSILFSYDAMNVRYEAGKHAQLINKISFDLHVALVNHSSLQQSFLKERLGHTFLEVLGGVIIGFFLTFVIYIAFH